MRINRSLMNFRDANFGAGRQAIRLLIASMLTLAVVLLFDTSPAAAQVSCADSSWPVGSEADLNAAIVCYNAKPAGAYSITLTQDILLSASTTTIDNSVAGAGATLTIEGGGNTLDGQNTNGVRPITITAGATVTINNLTVTGGNNDDGGGIQNLGILTVSNSTISGNTANTGGSMYGGGIYNLGTMTVIDSTVTGNYAGQYGGGIYSFALNSVLINRSTIYNNQSFDFGGGLFNQGNSMTIENSTISGNTAGFGNRVGGNGGGIYNRGGLTLDSTTVTTNTAIAGFGFGGKGGALYNTATSSGYLVNSILANSTNGITDCHSRPGTVTDGGSNLVESQFLCRLTAVTTDPNLGPLANNGGPTRTHLPLTGSPAIDAGNTGLGVDQRGVTRGGADDIGAVEVRGTIRIVKVTQPVLPPSSILFFEFTETITSGGGLFLLGPNDAPQEFQDISVGQYTVTESNIPPGWTLTDITCEDTVGSGTSSSGDVGTATATINLDPNETVTCTFTNTNPSLPITLGWFLAETHGDTVDFRWQTATESGVAGFNILVATGDGLVQLNQDLIASPVIDALSPTDYRVALATDATTFYLQEVGIDGRIVNHGPFVVGEEEGAYTGPDTNRSIFLPLMNK